MKKLNDIRAIPVDIPQLASHLEAYQKTKTTIETLRLCHRFGKGNKAKITDLPVELVTMIEQEVLHEPRAVAAERWGKMLACAENRCDPIEHVDEDELVDFAGEILYDSTQSLKDLGHLQRKLKEYLRGDFQCNCAAHSQFRAQLLDYAADWMDSCEHDCAARDAWETEVYQFKRSELLKVNHSHDQPLGGRC